MSNLAEMQSRIVERLHARSYKNVYEIIENGVNDSVIEELKAKEDAKFSEAVTKALSTSSNSSPIYKGTATAVLIDIEGNIKAFYSNNDESPSHQIFVKAALEKATARALLEKEGKGGGLSKHEVYLLDQGYMRHEGAAIKPLLIDGKQYFIGVSGASVNEVFNRKALRSDALFAVTGEEPEWRAAGYWDRFCANRIRTYMTNKNARQDMGKMKIPRAQAKKVFMN